MFIGSLLRVHVLCTCLWFFPMAPYSFAQGDVSSIRDQLNDLTVAEQEALKNIEISDGLQNAANNYAENVRPELTENDRKALQLLGYSDQEIDQLSLAALSDKEERDKFKNRLNRYASNKSSELEEGVMNDLVPGLGSAVLGLAFASLLGVVVGVRCFNQPSALAFAATSGAWIALEMMIWKGYQIRMDDIETLQNATKIPEKVGAKVNKVKKIIKDLESEFKKQNPQDAGSFEEFLANNQEKVDELKVIAEEVRGYLKTAKDRQFGALRSIQESIALAAETSKKKSRNAKVAAIGYTAAAGVATAEAANVFNLGGACESAFGAGNSSSGVFSSGHHMVIALVLKLMMTDTHAGFASIGDLDKIGIPLGGGLAAAYLGFEKTFADKIFTSATGRALVFLAMAGMAYLAYSKLAKAAVFLEKQANEMDIFVSAVEDKLNHLKATFPDGAELIRELKEELLPEIQDILNGINEKQDDIKAALEKEGSRLVDEKIGELGLSKEDLENQVKEQVKNEIKFDQNDIVNELKGVSNSQMGDLDASDFAGRLTTWQKIERFFIPEAIAAKKGFQKSSPISCAVRTRGYVALDDDCSCVAKKKCLQSRYPKKLRVAPSNEFGSFAAQLGSLVSAGSDQIFHGRPDKGLRAFEKAGSLYTKMDLNTRKFLSQKVGKKIDRRVTARLMARGYQSIRPALPDFYRGQGKKKSATLNPKLSKNVIRNNTQKLMSPREQRSALKASLRNKLALAKELGNKSLQGYQVKQAPQSLGAGLGSSSYNYAKEAIVRDSNKDLFELIKKRYLIIQSQGRL